MNLVEETMQGICQMIGESIALNKNPLMWIFVLAEFGEEYGQL